MAATDPRREAGAFLRARRAALRPADLGLVETGNLRRVPGLRRDEVARSAGVSVEYYTRLEQGRAGQPSAAVLGALASTLRLDDAARTYLGDLVAGVTGRQLPSAPELPAGVAALLAASELPMLVFGPLTDVRAWNPMAAALLTDFAALERRARNLARLIFLDAAFAALMADWEPVAEETVGVLRLAAGARADDPELAELVDELSVKSPAFRRLWEARDVRRKGQGPKRIVHPVVGRIDLQYQALGIPGAPGLTLVTYFAAAEADEARTQLELLRTVQV